MSLKYLTLIDCGIGNRALKEIATGVKEAICLQSIDLRLQQGPIHNIDWDQDHKMFCSTKDLYATDYANYVRLNKQI